MERSASSANPEKDEIDQVAFDISFVSTTANPFVQLWYVCGNHLGCHHPSSNFNTSSRSVNNPSVIDDFQHTVTDDFGGGHSQEQRGRNRSTGSDGGEAHREALFHHSL